MNINLPKTDLLLKDLKSGLKIATPYLPILYFFFFLLDLITTYFTSPDLKYEGNIFVWYFHINWIQILIFSTLYSILVNIFFLLSLYNIHSYFKLQDGKSFLYDLIHKKKLMLSFTMFVFFFIQFFYTFFIVFNNYLHYIYIFGIDNLFTRISDWYISIIIAHPHFFLIAKGIFLIISILFTFYQGIRIRKIYKKSTVGY